MSAANGAAKLISRRNLKLQGNLLSTCRGWTFSLVVSFCSILHLGLLLPLFRPLFDLGRRRPALSVETSRRSLLPDQVQVVSILE